MTSSTTDEKSPTRSEHHPPSQENTITEYFPPDVGVLPWLQALGGFFMFFNAWGTVLSFGSYQSYYTTAATFTDATQSDIAWIGSLESFLLLFVGALCGRAFDAGYLRSLIIAGLVFIVVGQMTASLAREYWQAVLSQGVCVGIGCGCLLVPSVGAASTWFVKRRGPALALVTSGAAIGGLVFPIATQKLITEVGFPWAIRVSGFVTLGTMCISLALMRPRLPPRSRGAFFEFSALKEPELAVYAVGMFTTLLGFYVLFNFVQDWALQSNISFGSLNPIYLLPILNAASLPGRIAPLVLSNKTGPLNLQSPAAILSGVILLAWIAVDSLAGLLVICILYALASGAFLSLPPMAVASLTTDLSRYGARMGVVFFFMSFGSLVGNPVSGAIIQGGRSGDDYLGAQVWAGCTMIGGGILIWTSRMILSKRKGRFFVKA